MFCQNCGTEINEGVKFCPNCGTNVTENNTQEKEWRIIMNDENKITQSVITETNSIAKPPKNKKRIIALILVLIGVVVIIFSAVKIYEKWNDNLENKVMITVEKMRLSDAFEKNISNDDNIILKEAIDNLFSDTPYWHSYRSFGDDICKVSVGNSGDIIFFVDDQVPTTNLCRPMYLTSLDIEFEYNLKSKTIENISAHAYGYDLNEFDVNNYQNYQYFYGFDKEAMFKMFLHEEVPDIEKYVLDYQIIEK